MKNRNSCRGSGDSSTKRPAGKKVGARAASDVTPKLPAVSTGLDLVIACVADELTSFCTDWYMPDEPPVAEKPVQPEGELAHA